MQTFKQRTRSAFEKVKTELLKRRTPNGHWNGRLSSSALSTAAAVSAMAIYLKNCPAEKHRFPFLEQSVQYLLKTQNADGNWGDTDKSFSNISTTFLVQSALALSSDFCPQAAVSRKLPTVNEIRQRYGKDQTFSVPILTNAALAGLVDWKDVPQLPFERAALPQWMFRLLRLQVVSYAIPALVAIGLCKWKMGNGNSMLSPLRRWAVKPTLKLIEKMQPKSGGYLEAAPLTAFVAMSLAGCGLAEHPVVQRCMQFLIDTVREDGSWAIDTNLATWATTLSVNALGRESFMEEETTQLADWILSCQHREKHPFTGAKPGGWGWTNLSGAVPDGDDTPGAMLALLELLPNIREEKQQNDIRNAVAAGASWLRGLQNSDGGMPTFCRGWGVLPFDKSSTDLTAHALRAVNNSQCRGFLKRQQQPDGSWVPLWFGNQHQPDDINPFYGTARVLLALRDNVDGLRWLLKHQNADGSWGNSIEETAVVLEALAEFDWDSLPTEERQTSNAAFQKGAEFLLNAVETDTYLDPSPIGLYFAKLWYYEELYPLIFTAAALRKMNNR
jgi:squalene-hopene/tetraprenyl-beta-curcumene cyclase